MRYWIVAVSIIWISTTACNAPEKIAEHKQEPQKPALTLAEVLPVMRPATQEAKARQEKFLDENVSRFKSKKLAAAYYVTEAKRTFEEQKLDSAVVQLHRAWLMDSTNNDIYWNYGRIFGAQKQYDKALLILYHALEADPENPQLLTDIATSYLGQFYATSNPQDLMQSKKLLDKALTLTTSQADIYYKLAINSYYMKDYSTAWAYLHKSLQQDKTIAGKNFISALQQKQQDPQGVFNGTSGR